VKRVLVVNPFGIGDVLFSMVLVEALRKALPADGRIGFLCNERVDGLVRLNTSIDRTFTFNRGLMDRLWRKSPALCWAKTRGLLDLIRTERFDTMIDLSLGRQYAFFAAFVGIRERVGFDFRGRGIFLNRKKKIAGYADAHVADTQLGLLDLVGVPYERGHARIPIAVPDSSKNEVAAMLRKHGFSDTDRLLAVAPGGGRSWGENGRYKQWSPERFAEAANAHGRKVILLGDKSERALLEKTASLIKPHSLVVCGEPFEKVGALLLRSKALLCNDGGLMHLANALGVPTVAVFGPVDERVYGPYGTDVPHEVLTEPVPCRPCYKDFRFPPCPHDRRCLELLPAERAVRALEKIA
jgi:ADP-heptose:LPS heptosyltransferase